MFISARNSNNSATLPVSCIFYGKKNIVFVLAHSSINNNTRRVCIFMIFVFISVRSSFCTLRTPHMKLIAATKGLQRWREEYAKHVITIGLPYDQQLFFFLCFSLLSCDCVCVCVLSVHSASQMVNCVNNIYIHKWKKQEAITAA